MFDSELFEPGKFDTLLSWVYWFSVQQDTPQALGPEVEV